jgi:hypothetical protein
MPILERTHAVTNRQFKKVTLKLASFAREKIFSHLQKKSTFYYYYFFIFLTPMRHNFFYKEIFITLINTIEKIESKMSNTKIC